MCQIISVLLSFVFSPLNKWQTFSMKICALFFLQSTTAASLRPPRGAWNKKQNKTLGVTHPSSGCNHRPYYTRCTSPPLIFNFILFPLYLRTPWNVILSAYNILSSPRPGVFLKKKKKKERDAADWLMCALTIDWLIPVNDKRLSQLLWRQFIFP